MSNWEDWYPKSHKPERYCALRMLAACLYDKNSPYYKEPGSGEIEKRRWDAHSGGFLLFHHKFGPPATLQMRLKYREPTSAVVTSGKTIWTLSEAQAVKKNILPCGADLTMGGHGLLWFCWNDKRDPLDNWGRKKTLLKVTGKVGGVEGLNNVLVRFRRLSGSTLALGGTAALFESVSGF